jgi:Predicted metal-dependent enzyme
MLLQEGMYMANKKTSIGGQALMEGIMMRGPQVTAMAVRDPQGEIVLEEYPTKGVNRGKFFKLPFIRGIFNLFDSLSCGYKYLMRSAEICGMDAEEEEKRKARGVRWYDKLMDAVLMPVATVLAVALALVLFFWLPMELWSLLTRVAPGLVGHYFLRALFEGLFRIAIFVLYVWATSLMKDIRRTYMYHGGEHKTIFCYEAGLPLTVENVRKQKRFHPRCGTSFITLVLVVSILVSSLIRIDTLWLRMCVKLPLIPVVVGISYELIRLAGRKDNLFTRIISAPGLALQRLTVFEPDGSMIECAIAAMEKVIPEDGSDVW